MNRILHRIKRNVYRRSPEERVRTTEVGRLAKAPRYQRGASSLFGFSIEYSDACTFLDGGRKIFEREIYRFSSDSGRPRILDCGANIGLSTLYFKKLFPEAEIHAFEADPGIAEILRHNCANNGFADVTIVPAAVWIQEGEIPFAVEGGFSGKVVGDLLETGNTRLVRTVRLKPYLETSIDMLKIDIEGSEWPVLMDCKNLLHNVRNLFVEYHSSPGQPQELGGLLELLKEGGFRYHIQGEFERRRPFVDTNLVAGFDMAVNVFAYRDARPLDARG